MDNTIDYNSDGVKDFSWKSEQMMYSNNNYDVWIFDSQTSQFKKLEVEFEGSFCNPAPDLKKKELTIGCITGSAGLEYHNARFSFNNEKLILVEHNLGYTSEKKDEAIFQVIRALTPGSPLMNICECSYNTITRKIKKCSVQKEKCKNFLPTTGD